MSWTYAEKPKPIIVQGSTEQNLAGKRFLE